MLASHDQVQLVTFSLDDQEFALPLSSIVQVVRMVAITPVPEAPEIVKGMINVRGKVVPVIDLRRRFGLPSKPYGLNTHLLIVRHAGQMIALVVDAVSGVLSMPNAYIEPPTDMGSQVEGVAAVGKLGSKLLLILDLGKLLSTNGKDRWSYVLAQLSQQASA